MKKVIAFTILFIALTSRAFAGPIAITSYDITNAMIAGTGGWSHTYSGVITQLGNGVANYSGGSGTLNNGVIETNHPITQLFNYPQQTSPVITLFFDGFYTIESLLIYGGNFLGNSIPGTLTGLNISINGISENFSTSGQGLFSNGRYADDFASLTGSSLQGLVTNQISLSGFTSTWGTNTFSIAEISISGEVAQLPAPASVSAPASLGLLGLGLMLMASLRRKARL